jgi:hypothetical protein
VLRGQPIRPAVRPIDLLPSRRRIRSYSLSQVRPSSCGCVKVNRYRAVHFLDLTVFLQKEFAKCGCV